MLLIKSVGTGYAPVFISEVANPDKWLPIRSPAFCRYYFHCIRYRIKGVGTFVVYFILYHKLGKLGANVHKGPNSLYFALSP